MRFTRKAFVNYRLRSKQFLIRLFASVSRTEFHLTYDGPALKSGSMDVNQLAPALLSVNDLLRAVNEEVNGDTAQVSTRVKADFRQGSFDIALLFDQSLIEHAKTLFTPGQITDAAGIIGLVFGSGVTTGGTVWAISSLLDLWKKLKGEKPNKDVIEDAESHTTITINAGDNSTVSVDAKMFKLYGNEKIRASIEGAVKPLTREGVNLMEVRKGKKVLDKVTKGDLPPAIGESGAPVIAERDNKQPRVSNRETMLRVTRANFEKGKWGFSDGNAKFSAEIADKEFQRKLDAKEEGFFKGDTLLVDLSTSQTVTEAGAFETRYIIDRVLDHFHAPTQQHLKAIPEGTRRDLKRLPPSQE